ncbi:MAG: EamA/RhaT family transporter [Ruminococcaceae bacterium]|nr:EamA/RhaT family transporter [Oscillospiraceae bacterium]
MKPSHNSARIGMIGAMSVFGSIGLFVRMIPLPSAEIALYRAILALLLLETVLIYRRMHPQSNRTTGEALPYRRRLGHPLLWLSGAAIGFNWILLFEAYRYTTVSTATLAYYFSPVLVTVLSPILFHEQIGVCRIACFLLSTAGVVLMTGAVSVSADDLCGIALGLGAACLYAAVVLINKGMSNRVPGDPVADDPISRTVVQFLAAAIVLLPYVLLTSGIQITVLDSIGWAALLCIGFLHTGATYAVYFASLRGISGQEAALLSYIDPLIAVILSVFILGEDISAMQGVGGVLILGASVINTCASASSDSNG